MKLIKHFSTCKLMVVAESRLEAIAIRLKGFKKESTLFGDVFYSRDKYKIYPYKFTPDQEVNYVGEDSFLLGLGKTLFIKGHWDLSFVMIKGSPMSYPVSDFVALSKGIK